MPIASGLYLAQRLILSLMHNVATSLEFSPRTVATSSVLTGGVILPKEFPILYLFEFLDLLL